MLRNNVDIHENSEDCLFIRKYPVPKDYQLFIEKHEVIKLTRVLQCKILNIIQGSWKMEM